MEQLKSREQDILNFMKEEVQKKGYPPTVREICAALNIKSTSTVHKDIARLEKKGFIKKDPAKPRAIAFALGSENGKASKAVSVSQREDVLDVPIVGSIAAGTPITAEENVEGTFPVPKEFAKGNNFMLTVRGDSMIEAGIFDGDKILVREQTEAKNGEIVVALLHDFETEGTVKTYYKEKDHIRLQPENPEYEPIITKDCKIVGVVKGVFRYIN